MIKSTRRRPNQVHHFQSTAVQAVGVELHTVAFAHYRCQRPHEWRRSERYGLIYFADGDGFFEAEGMGRQPIIPGTALWLFPGQNHWRQPSIGGFWDHYWIFVSGPVIEELEHAGHLDRARPLHKPGPASALQALFDQALNHAAAGDPEWTCGRLLEFVRLSTAGPASRLQKDTLVEKASSRLQADPAQQWNYEDLARELGVSYPTLRRRFRAARKQSLHQFVQELRLQTACGLLLHGAPVKQVAADVGIPDQTHFTRLFRRRFGCTPGEYTGSGR